MNIDKYKEIINNHDLNIDDDLMEKIIIYMYTSNYIYDFDEIRDFVSGCKKIQDKIEKRIREITDGSKLYIIAPGDSPSKIINYLQKNKMYDRCEYISFPLSNMVGNEDNRRNYKHSVKYIASFLPLLSSNFLIIDYVARGSTIKGIINGFKYFKKVNKYCIDRGKAEELKKELKTILDVRSKRMSIFNRLCLIRFTNC